MHWLKWLWQDENGAVVTAEAVLVGTVGVLAAAAGLRTMSHAIDDELKEIGYAIRSLDQSYSYCGLHGCGAWTAGSSYVQPGVEESLAELRTRSEAEASAAGKDLHRKGATPESDDKQPKKNRSRKKGMKTGAANDEPAPPPNDLPSSTEL